MKLENSDLILCVNLLDADARAWERGGHPAYAASRRELSAKMMEELSTRGATLRQSIAEEEQRGAA